MSTDYADLCGCTYYETTDVQLYRPHIIRRAQKAHSCHECAGGVRVGERYESAFVLVEGRAQTYRTCCRCLALREWLHVHLPCFCWLHTNLREDVIETAKEFAWRAQIPGFLFRVYRLELTIRRAEKRACGSGRDDR